MSQTKAPGLPMETGRPSCTVFRTEAGPGSDDRPQFDGIALVTVTPRVISPRVLSGRSTGTTNVFFMNPPFRESDSRNLPPGSGSGKLGDARTRGREDAGTRGRGDAGTRGRGDAGTRGRGDAGTRGRGDPTSLRGDLQGRRSEE